MPYKVFKKDDKWCVYKVDEEKNPVGDTLGCHPSSEAAAKQIIAVNMSENMLQHYGVLGMRWGRRSGGRGSGAKRQGPSSSEASSVAKLRKKKANELTNEELKKVNERINLERQFKSLNPTRTDRAKKLVADIMGNAAKTAITEVAKNTISKQLQGIVDTKIAAAVAAKAAKAAAGG